MLNVFKRIKEIFSTNEEKENVSSDTEIPGTYEAREDVGKKVFEKTGQLREGVGQSSTASKETYEKKTTAEAPETPVKLHHGIRKRKNVVNVSSKTNPVSKSTSKTSGPNSNSNSKKKYKQRSK